MIVGGAYQPVATATLDAITDLEAEARELWDAHRLDRADDHGRLSANDLCRLSLLLEALDRLGGAVWRSLILPDWSDTWRALCAAQTLTRTYARHLHALQAKETGEAARLAG